MNPLYKKLLQLSKTATLLSSAQALLDWDRETKMPEEGGNARALMLETLSGIVHKHKTSPKIGKLLEQIDPSSLSPQEKACFKKMQRDYLKLKKLPNAFVKKLTETTSKATLVWQEARAKNSFSLFAPYLEKVISLHRKKADLLGYEEHPYNALLDLYEPDLSIHTLNPLFSTLQKALSTLLTHIQSRKTIDDACLCVKASQDIQFKLGHAFLEKVELTKKVSRLDLSAHPFCTSFHPRDVRMTTAIKEKNPLFSFFAVLHEGGHALYDQGLLEEHYGTPLGEAISLGIHESQSRWWETRIGQSLSFWQHFYPLFQKELPELNAIPLETFYRAVNSVTPSLIRIEADEVTYNLHIILRFELEKKLIEGSLKIKEIPELWNHLMQTYLHITPPTDKEGCLQDIHWSCGLIGYFPTYTLGNLFASQFFEAFAKEHPEWEKKVAQGELLFIRNWLKEKIHVHGREFSSQELCQKITGRPLSEAPFIDYLNQKYQRIYSN